MSHSATSVRQLRHSLGSGPLGGAFSKNLQRSRHSFLSRFNYSWLTGWPLNWTSLHSIAFVDSGLLTSVWYPPTVYSTPLSDVGPNYRRGKMRDLYMTTTYAHSYVPPAQRSSDPYRYTGCSSKILMLRILTVKKHKKTGLKLINNSFWNISIC